MGIKIKKIANNVSEITKDNTSILYSYETPVACKGANGFFKTSTKHSVTTSKHINQWGAKYFEQKPQEFLIR